MKIDMVFPNNNEPELIKTANKLGYEGLCLVYKSLKDLKNKKKAIKYSNMYFGLLVKPSTVTKCKNIADMLIVESSPKNRIVFENKNADMILGIETSPKKDKIHHRSSGLNQVLCKLAHKNKIQIAISYTNLINSNKFVRVNSMGRISQNIRFCRKYNVKIAIASFARSKWEMRSPHDLMSLGIVLGMHPSEAKFSIRNVARKIMNNQSIRKGDKIADGIHFVIPQKQQKVS